MKKTYEPTRSDIETLYSIQSREKEIERIMKEGKQIRIGLIISGIIAFVTIIFYSKNELAGFLSVPFMFCLLFYFLGRKEQSTLGQKIKYVDELGERVECHYTIENHKVYIIQKDGKRIELNQY
jgi:hypothetical protein